jgi:type IV pilus assembly protein PilA
MNQQASRIMKKGHGMQKGHKRNKVQGFTLIEIMIVIAIIGVLAAIAIPQFSLYRVRSFNAAAQADLKNAATAQEAYFMDHGTYCPVKTDLIGATYMLFFSEGVDFAILDANTEAYGYLMRARHERGDTTFTLSGPGGSIN